MTAVGDPQQVGVPAQERARELLSQTRTEIEHADAKASILIAGALAAVGAVVATGGGGTWDAAHAWWIRALAWLGAALVALGVVLLVLVLYPRERVGNAPAGVGYFRDVVRLGSPERLRAALLDPLASSFEVTVDQLWQVSTIVQRKYRLLRTGLAVLGAGFGALGDGLRSRDFWLLSGSFFICGASTNGLIGTHLVPACMDHGMPEVRAAVM